MFRSVEQAPPVVQYVYMHRIGELVGGAMFRSVEQA
jgi:hypothetical protein